MNKTTAKIVNEIVDYANSVLRNSADDQVDFRHGVHAMVEQVLMSNDAYNGFRYLNERDMDDVRGNTPGVRNANSFGQERMVDGVDTWFIDTDSTRRQYSIRK